jgi:hypothetical protein
MLLKTQFENEPEVFYLKNTKVLSNRINSTQINVESGGKVKVDYFIKVQRSEKESDYSIEMINESECFTSRESLIAQL